MVHFLSPDEDIQARGCSDKASAMLDNCYKGGHEREAHLFTERREADDFQEVEWPHDSGCYKWIPLPDQKLDHRDQGGCNEHDRDECKACSQQRSVC